MRPLGLTLLVSIALAPRGYAQSVGAPYVAPAPAYAPAYTTAPVYLTQPAYVTAPVYVAPMTPAELAARGRARTIAGAVLIPVGVALEGVGAWLALSGAGEEFAAAFAVCDRSTDIRGVNCGVAPSGTAARTWGGVAALAAGSGLMAGGIIAAATGHRDLKRARLTAAGLSPLADRGGFTGVVANVTVRF